MLSINEKEKEEEKMNKKEFQLSVSETIEQYQVPSIDQGLTEAQVTERLETYGLNQLAVKKPPSGVCCCDNSITRSSTF